MDLRQLLRGDEYSFNTLKTTQSPITGVEIAHGGGVSASVLPDDVDDAEEAPNTYNAAWFSLYDTWDIYSELDLETKDANLAGLLFHQNLPARLRGISGEWLHYKKLHKMCAESDLADYWAFFHQCWVLLGISNNFKLKFPNTYLANHPYTGTVPDIGSLEYTWVLTKQSALFNTWKEMLRLSENSGVSLRLISDFVAVTPATKYTGAITLSPVTGAAEAAGRKKGK